MPTKPKHYCAYPNCNNLTDKTYCDEHKGLKKSNSGDSKPYDRKWRRIRDYKLKLNPLCEECLKQGRIILANEVHHIKPVDYYPELRLDIDNLESLCKVCHEKITAKEKKLYKKDK